MQGLFITGTDTGVGKTQTACLIVQSLAAARVRVGAYKPVCSGTESDRETQACWGDVERLQAALGRLQPIERICPQRFLAPLAPPEAARKQGCTVDYDLCVTGAAVWQDHSDILIVEGAGGWLCPLTDDRTMADLALDLQFPVVVVAANRLGTINHTLLTLESIRHRGLPVVAVILSDVTPTTDESGAVNLETLRRHAQVPVLAQVAHRAAEIVTRERPLTGVDWQVWAARDGRTAPTDLPAP